MLCCWPACSSISRERERGLPKVSSQKEHHFWHYKVIILCLALLQTYFWLSDTPKLVFVFVFGPCLIIWAGYLIHEAPSKLFSRTSSIKMGAVEPIPVQSWSQNAWQISVAIMRGWCLWLPCVYTWFQCYWEKSHMYAEEVDLHLLHLIKLKCRGGKNQHLHVICICRQETKKWKYVPWEHVGKERLVSFCQEEE